MGTGFSKKKKEAKMMQQQLGKMQQEMTEQEVTGTAPNELVHVVLNGNYEIKNLKIKPECFDKDDIEGLEDLIKFAFNDATEKLKNKSMEGLSGFPGLPFGF